MKNSKKTAKVMLVGALTLAMSVTTLFSNVGESYAASELKLNKTSRNILTRRSYDFDVVGASEDAEITWKSSNEKVATVDKDGVVTGITKGEAKITCTIKDGGETVKLTATAKIRKPAVKIAIRNKIDKLEVGEEYDLNRKLTPSTSNDVTTWKSSNKKIATVDKNGVVTAKANGTVTITATTMSGKTDSVEIKVYGGKATATPKPEAPKATQAPKATATPKPQAPAKAETKTFTFAQLTNPTDKGGVWACQVATDGGKLTMTSDAGSIYTQSFWQLPVDMKNVEKVTFNGVKGAGFEVRMMTADEYTAYDGSQSFEFQGSDTSYATNGAALGYFVVVSKDGSEITIDSISLTMKAGGAAAEKPAAGASKYTFAKMTQPEDKGKNWACQTAVDGAGKLTMTSDAGSVWTQSFWKLPDGVDMSKVKKMTFNGVTGAGFEVRIMTADQYTAYDGNANQEATFQGSETSYATNGAAIAYFIVVSKDGTPITIDSISFE